MTKMLFLVWKSKFAIIFKMDDDDIIFSSYGGNRWILTGGTTLPPPQSVENIRDPPPQDAKKTRSKNGFK